MVRHSGLQRQVLSFYRACLKEAQKKPEVSLFLLSPFTSFYFLVENER